MADRDAFIQQLVAALKENESLSDDAALLSSPFPSSNDAPRADLSSQDALEPEKSPSEATGLFQLNTASSNGDNEKLAKEAHIQLQYDFPQVQEASIEALAELYRRLAAEKSYPNVTGQIPITTTLLDGVAYLNDQGAASNSSGQHQRTRSSEGSGLLAAAVLLLVFKGCLETSEGSGVSSLLKSLNVKQQQVKTLQAKELGSDAVREDQLQEKIFVEKYAAQEDPDDLSEWNNHPSSNRKQREPKRKSTPLRSTAHAVSGAGIYTFYETAFCGFLVLVATPCGG
ncbi:hypothetical protein BBO99_00009401 [Phytophthora kernoviae]|uniref:Uncharacterized protein n=2 Tax=Phytophthora kernoviae TaxID=325452 RepID=A0A3R7NA35_9STRA|nr:hypothetical protein G195_010830 [Phytophthora kernoviae 00238/432]KAG2504678.1 hypothetical protein JM16_009298 [Phytophthora kernoviae]KAG2507296.1 hypothetical protein JM18_008705 [Phytophthora kernoviae]RLN20757.1 hypothetical protein BBI17_009424 [Phytophthora kernoviae]RLN73447.1 hypothetical protein BBO99_00009401 [Phytophthora kernoviae]